MPTTSNFGWNTPADTDLVKDGAAAIRTLGNNIDASLVDLKGGTTGQVLAKATNTDLDFTWVAQDDSNAIQNAIVDAKGDLITATAADVPARLGVGANGTVLTADSTTATGLKWATASSLDDYQLINAGGTALTGASTITVSGISGKNSLIIFVSGASANQSTGDFAIQFNSDSGSNYTYIGPYQDNTGALAWNSGLNATSFQIGAHFNSAANTLNAVMKVDGAGATGWKWINNASYFSGAGRQVQYSGYYKGTSAITSVSILQLSGAGQFDAGTIFVYGA